MYGLVWLSSEVTNGKTRLSVKESNWNLVTKKISNADRQMIFKSWVDTVLDSFWKKRICFLIYWVNDTNPQRQLHLTIYRISMPCLMLMPFSHKTIICCMPSRATVRSSHISRRYFLVVSPDSESNTKTLLKKIYYLYWWTANKIWRSMGSIENRVNISWSPFVIVIVPLLSKPIMYVVPDILSRVYAEQIDYLCILLIRLILLPTTEKLSEFLVGLV